MKVIRTVKEMRACRASFAQGKRVGFIATMGALHEGHLSLIRRSVCDMDITVVSIFVNPMQFAPGEDLSTYPRKEEDDLRLCGEAGANVAFLPEVSETYPEAFDTWVTTGVGSAERNRKAEGHSRPTFFRGVATILMKLFWVVRPCRVYFGQKDAQQCAVVRRLVEDMWTGIELAVGETVREPDGLAMSSRNVYLGEVERKEAGRVYKGLRKGVELFEGGERDVETLRREVEREVSGGGLRVLYVSLCERWTMKEVEGKVRGNAEWVLCVAAMLGKTRLIDNVVLSGSKGT